MTVSRVNPVENAAGKRTQEVNVWVIDDDASIRWVLERAFKKQNWNVDVFASAEGVLDRLSQRAPDVIVTDIRMPGMDGLELMGEINQRVPGLPVVVMTAHTDLESAVAAYGGGAFEYLPKPFDINEAIHLIQRALDQHRDESFDKNSIDKSGGINTEMLGEAVAMQEVFRAVGRLSHSTINVLITGESGTGKELIANALQQHSPRKDNAFVAINTAAIPAELLESELFGHEKGAFTGAQNQRLGRFEQAHGGTLFLDEIGDMPADLQTRLLRVLSEGSFYRVGGHRLINVDVRVIAATNQDLQAQVKVGKFREDLFHRLNVIRIQLPPLRERFEDIEILSDYFLRSAARELKVEAKLLSDEAVAVMKSYHWPGNVRELENSCRWLTVMSPANTIAVEDLPQELLQQQDRKTNTQQPWEESLEADITRRLNLGQKQLLSKIAPRFEAILIAAALKFTDGHKQEAAKCVGWGRNTLTRKLNELVKKN